MKELLHFQKKVHVFLRHPVKVLWLSKDNFAGQSERKKGKKEEVGRQCLGVDGD